MTWIQGNLKCLEVFHQTAGDKMCSQITLPYWEAALNLPEIHPTARDAAWCGLQPLKLLQFRLCGTTLLTCPLSLCLVFYKGASNNWTICLVIFNVLKCFSLFQGSLDVNAGHILTLHYRALLSLVTKDTQTWSWATGSKVALLEQRGWCRWSPELSPHLNVAYFSHTCNVHIGEV